MGKGSTALEYAIANNIPYRIRGERLAGDANGDGRLTAADARLALRASAKLEELDDMGFAAADLDPDGRITAREARWILRASAKLETI